HFRPRYSVTLALPCKSQRVESGARERVSLDCGSATTAENRNEKRAIRRRSMTASQARPGGAEPGFHDDHLCWTYVRFKFIAGTLFLPEIPVDDLDTLL